MKAPQCTFLRMHHTTRPTFKGIQLGQSAEPGRRSDEPHRLRAARAATRRRCRIVGALFAHETDSMLEPDPQRGVVLGSAGQPAKYGARRPRLLSVKATRLTSARSIELMALLRSCSGINLWQSKLKRNRLIGTEFAHEARIHRNLVGSGRWLPMNRKILRDQSGTR